MRALLYNRATFFLITFVIVRVTVVYQKRLRRERKARKRVQDQLEQELKRRAQLEDMIKAAGAPADALRVLTGTRSCDLTIILYVSTLRRITRKRVVNIQKIYRPKQYKISCFIGRTIERKSFHFTSIHLFRCEIYCGQ